MTPPEAVDPLDEVKRSVWVQCFILSIIKWWTGNRGVRSPTLSWKNCFTSSRRASRTQGRNTRGAAELRKNQSGHWDDSCDAKRSTSTLLNKSQIWATVDGSTFTLPTWASVLTESRLRGYMGYYHHVVRPDNHMTPPEWGEKVNQCQEDCSQLQAVYVPGLPCPNSAPQPVRDATIVTIWRSWIAPILTPLWRKMVSRHIKRVRKQLRDTLTRQVAGSVERKPKSFIHGTASCGAPQGRLQPWGLRACDKCSRRHDGLTWSRVNMY